MKRKGNIFKQIIDWDNLYVAFINAKKGKGWYAEVIVISQRPWYYLAALRWMLITGRYRTSEYTMQQRKEGGKIRELYKLPFFPDRIAQWAILQVIAPDILASLIDETYSALPGRGIHAAFQDLRDDLDYHPDEMTECCKIDCKSFYASIDHSLLKGLHRKKFKDPDLLKVTDEIVDSISTCPATPDRIQWYQRHGIKIRTVERDGKEYIEGVGIPIGNYMSQWDGNFFLSRLDHYCKEVLHIRHYRRYMDDIVFFAKTKEELIQHLAQIRAYLSTELHLRLKDNYQIFPTFIRGVDFLGYRFFRNYTLLRKSTCQSMKRKMTLIRSHVEAGRELTYHEYCSINSYKGWLEPANCKRLTDTYITPLLPYADAYYKKHIESKKKKRKSAGRETA